MWISEQTSIISLYSINWLVFITETECVYCAVRTDLQVWCKLFSSLQTVPWSRRSFAGLSSCMPRFDVRSVHLSFVVDRVAEGQFSVRVLPFPPVSILSVSTKAPDSPSSKCCSYQKDKQEKAGDLPKRKTLSEIWELAVIFLPSYILNGNHLIKSCNFCWNVQETVPRLFVRSKFINTLLLPLHASGLKIAGCKRTWNEVKGWTALWT